MIKNLMVRRNAFNGETFIFSEADMDCVAGVPIWAQRLLFAALAPLARWRGYQVVIGPTRPFAKVGMPVPQRWVKQASWKSVTVPTRH